MAGYSGKPLAQKLGINAGAAISAINAPSDYRKLLGSISKSVIFNDTVAKNATFVHLFVIKRDFRTISWRTIRISPALPCLRADRDGRTIDP